MPSVDRNLIDTSWYVEALTDAKVEEAIRMIGSKTNLKSCETILEKEIEKSGVGALIELHSSVIAGVIKLKPAILETANLYAQTALETHLLSRRVVDKMKKGDFLIVASASFDNIQRIFTKNRRTMAKPESIKIYDIVNAKMNWKTPQIIKTRKELLDYALSL